MTTNTNMTYFGFVGGKDCPSSSAAFIKKELQSKPDSLLFCLASKTWNHGDDSSAVVAGTRIDKPIETHPMAKDSPIRDVWQPSMVKLLESAYKRASDESLKISLPHGVHIEHAMTVLEFYGLPVADPNEDFDVNGITPVYLRLQTLLYLKDQTLCRQVVDRVISHLEKNPKSDTKFDIVQNDGGIDLEICDQHFQYTQSQKIYVRVGLSGHHLDPQTGKLTEEFKTAVWSLFERKGFDRSSVTFCASSLTVRIHPLPSINLDKSVSRGTKRKVSGSIN